MKPSHWRTIVKNAPRGITGLCVGLFLLVQAMAASPALHLLIHPDAADQNHQCAVTLFTHGQACFSDTQTAPVLAPPIVSLRQMPAPARFVSIEVRYLPCRGPPAHC